jgi:hypothetical protein
MAEGYVRGLHVSLLAYSGPRGRALVADPHIREGFQETVHGS